MPVLGYNLEICASDGCTATAYQTGKQRLPMPAVTPGTSGLNQPNVCWLLRVLDNTLMVCINNQLASVSGYPLNSFWL